jgi:hypothetical protein
VDDNGGLDAVDDADLIDDRVMVGPDDHREAFVEFKEADWVFLCVADVLVADAVLAGGGRDDQLRAHLQQVTLSSGVCRGLRFATQSTGVRQTILNRRERPSVVREVPVDDEAARFRGEVAGSNPAPVIEKAP